MEKLTLYSYFRSSAAYRVRIALNLKGLCYDQRFVHLVKGGGEQHSNSYREINPQRLVPSLMVGATILTQSAAICEYLEETYRIPPLFPSDPAARAYIRGVMQAIACDIHPLNNTRVLSYLTKTLDLLDAEKAAWYRHWVEEGLAAIEIMISKHGDAGKCCHGDDPTFADAFLIPQLFNARRFDIPLDAYPRLTSIESHCLQLKAFIAAHPSAQPDAENV
jgi:maleylacetoacetate isomerase